MRTTLAILLPSASIMLLLGCRGQEKPHLASSTSENSLAQVSPSSRYLVSEPMAKTSTKLSSMATNPTIEPISLDYGFAAQDPASSCQNPDHKHLCCDVQTGQNSIKWTTFDDCKKFDGKAIDTNVCREKKLCVDDPAKSSNSKSSE